MGIGVMLAGNAYSHGLARIPPKRRAGLGSQLVLFMPIFITAPLFGFVFGCILQSMTH